VELTHVQCDSVTELFLGKDQKIQSYDSQIVSNALKLGALESILQGKNARFEFLKAGLMRIFVFLDVTPCSLV
jgi:hypothetical protein